MFKKVLHAGNMGAALGAVVTAAMAADLTLIGGAGGLIAAALSGSELFTSLDKDGRARMKQMAAGLEQALSASPLGVDGKKLVLQLMANYPVSNDDLAQGNQTPSTIAANMRQRIADRETAKPNADPAITDKILAAYEAILTQTLQPITDTPAGIDPLQAAMLKELLKRSDESGRADKLRDEGITEKAIIRLAQRITENVDKVGQAWLELQNAMDIAVRLQTEGQIKSNHGDFVDTVLSRVADLAKDGDYTTAGAAIDDALDEADAQILRLLDSGIEVALLDRDTQKAAKLLVRKADTEAGGMAPFGTLKTLQDGYYEAGRNTGSRLDSTLAINLADIMLQRAATAHERGMAGNSLGNALATLGARETGTARLDQAVEAYTEAVKERTRKKVPMDWAITQMNLGNALKILGARETGTARLDQAVEAYSQALKEHTREKAPMNGP